MGEADINSAAPTSTKESLILSISSKSYLETLPRSQGVVIFPESILCARRYFISSISREEIAGKPIIEFSIPILIALL